MQLSPKHLQTLYHAYCKTDLLWKGNAIFNLKQLDIPRANSTVFLRTLERRLRLGQMAEQFVFNQLQSCETIELLAENIQVQKEKQTLGELDTLVMVDKQPIHLEIIYKFYVYDETLGNSELERWIGPNRKDSLIEKLTKLRDKQLPLLYSDACKLTLQDLELSHFSFAQQVLFKAQLFLPYQREVNFKLLNKDCVCGWYIHSKQLQIFQDCEFYIPSKLDWFLEPNDTVEWLAYSNFLRNSDEFLKNSQSPLFWLKDDKQKLSKAFLVWW